MKKNHKIPFKIIRRAISSILAVAMMTTSMPMSYIADEVSNLSGMLFVHAAQFEHPDIPEVENIYLGVSQWSSFDEASGITTYTLLSPNHLIAYSWLYKENASNHTNDVLIFAYSNTSADASATSVEGDMTGYQQIGESEATAFRGRIEVNPSTSAEISLGFAMFGYLADCVKICEQGQSDAVPPALKKLVFMRSQDDTGKPLLADHIVHDQSTATPNEWTIEVWNYKDSGANFHSYSYGGIIGEIEANANCKLSVTDNTSALIWVNDADLNDTVEPSAGRICGAMKSGAVLEVTKMEGASVSGIYATNGHAGGLIGSMESGARLKLSSDISGANAPNAEIHAEGTGHYAGGLVGYCNGGYIISGTTYTIENQLFATAGAGGVYGYYAPYTDTPVLGEGEIADSTSFNLAHYSINCELNGTGDLGGLFGKLDGNGMDITITADDSMVKYESGTGGTEGVTVCFGGLIGKYTAASLENSLTITGGTSISSQKTGTAALYGGVIGEVVGDSYAYFTGINVSANNANTLTFGGAVAQTSAGYLDVNDLTVSVNGYHGGGVAGNIGNGVLRLSGYTDLTGAKGTSEAGSGQIVGVRDSALVFAESDWNLKRYYTVSDGKDTVITLDDIGSWGQVVRFDETKMLRDAVITLDTTAHTVTLLDADVTNNLIQLSDAASYARAALNMQINDSQRTTGALRTSASSLSADLLAMNINMTSSIDLSGTGMIGLTRDNGTHLAYSGTSFNGNGNTLTLAIGEAYGKHSETTVSNSDTYGGAGGGLIYRHTHNGLFAETTNAIVISDLSFAGIIDAHSWTTGTYIGSAIADCKGGITYTATSTNSISAQIKHYGGSAGAIGGLAGRVSGGNCIVENTNFECNITGNASASDIGGAVGAFSNGGTFSSSFSSVSLTGTVKSTGERSAQKIGGLIGTIAKSSASKRSAANRKLTLSTVTIGDANIPLTVEGTVKDTGSGSTKAALSTGGLLGYSWCDTEVELNGITVTNGTVKANKVAGNSNTFNADMGGLVYLATGYWKVQTVNLSGISVVGSPRSLGMLVNRGWHKDDSSKASLYLELPSGHSYTLSSSFNTAPSEVFDELVAFSAEYKDNASTRDNAKVTENGQGVVSIHTSGNAVTMTGSACNTYQNQTAVSYSGANSKTSKGNPNTRYYYNLDTIRANPSPSDAEKLMLWSLHKYADKNLIAANYFGTNPYSDNEIVPSSTGNQFNMVGYSYYPVDLTDEEVSIYGSVVFYNHEIEEAEKVTGGDSYARTTLDESIATKIPYTQHYLMHNGLFHNVTVSQISVDGELKFSGSIGLYKKNTESFSGALVCGKMIGTDADNISSLVVKKSSTPSENGSIVLDGIAVHNKTTYSPLLINQIGSFTTSEIRNVYNTDAYSTGTNVANGDITTTNQAASSLIGKVGAEYTNNVLTSKGINIKFEKIKLDGRTSDGGLTDAGLNKAYKTKHSIFTQATLLDEFTCTGSKGTYTYEIAEDWGSSKTSNSDDARNVTYGEEIGYTSADTQYPGKENKYLESDGTNKYETRYDADPRNNPTGTLDYTKFLPYVREAYSLGANHQQLEVNHGKTAFSGCGTYNDPYIIDANGQLEDIADALAGVVGEGFDLNYPNATTRTNQWCEEKTGHNRYILQGGTYKQYKPRQLYMKQTGTVNNDPDGDPIFEEDDEGNPKYYAITATDQVVAARQQTLQYPSPKTDAYKTDDTVEIDSVTYIKATGETEDFVSENDSVDATTMRTHLAGAYYLVKNNIQLRDTYTGLGKRHKDDTTDLAVFHGVIDSAEGYEIENLGNVPLIVNSNGSVVRNVTLKVKRQNINVSQGKAEEFTSTTGVAYGAVFGKILGGDNIIDNVNVTFDAITSFSTGGNNAKLAAVGGYVGAVVNGDVIFRNMARTKTNSDGTTEEKVYGLTSSVTDKIGESNTAWLYFNPIIGRVINGFAVTEADAYRPFEDGSRKYGDDTIEYWLETITEEEDENTHEVTRTITSSVSTDSEDAANKVGVTMKNGNKNYSITDIDKNDTSLFTSTTVSNGAFTAATIENAQAFFLMSVMVNSGMNATALGFASGNRFRMAEYTAVGTTASSSAKPDDFTKAATDKTADVSWFRYRYATKESSNYAVKPSTITLKSGAEYYLPDGYKGIGNIYQNDDNYRLALTKLNGEGAKISQNTIFYYYNSDYHNSTTKIGYLPNRNIDSGIGLINYMNTACTFENLYLTGNLQCDMVDLTKGTWITSTAKTCDTTAYYLCGGMLIGTANQTPTIKNVAIQNVNVFSVRNTGGLIGFVENQKTFNYSIDKTVSSAAYNSDKIKVHGRASTGGLVGKINEGYANVDMNGHTFNLKEVVCESTDRGEKNDYNYGVGGFVGMLRANNNNLNTTANYFKNIVIGTPDKKQVVKCVAGAQLYTAGVVGIMNKARGVTIENCTFYNLSVESKYHAGGLVGYPTTSTPVTATDVHLYSPLGSTIQGVDAGGFVGRSNDSKSTNNNGDGSRTFIIKNCSIDGYTISGSTNAGGVVGYRGAYTKERMELDNFSISRCIILSDGNAGGITGSLDQALNGYNILSQNIEIDSITEGKSITKGYICGNNLNTSTDKGVIQLVGFSRQDDRTGDANKMIAPIVGAGGYGTDGYVVFADYNGSCLTSEIPNGFTGSKTFSTVNNGSNVTVATINNTSDNTPYVTSSPSWQIDTAQFLTGDPIYGITYDTSVIKKILTDRNNETLKSYQFASYTPIEGYATAEKFTDLLKTKYTDVVSALGSHGTDVSKNFPVLVVDSLDQKYTTALINNYIRMLTNTDFDYANMSNTSIYTVAIQKWSLSGSTWSRTGTPESNGSLNDSDANLKRSNNVQHTEDIFYITAGHYDNTATQITLLDVQFKNPSKTTEVAYHLYVPVVVKKMLRYGFESSFKTGTNYNLEYYTPKANFLPENFGNPVTLEFSYTYQQKLSEWEEVIKSGESLLYAYNKRLVFKDEPEKLTSNNGTISGTLPPGAKLVLVDQNRQDQMYYGEWSTDGGVYTYYTNNQWYLNLTKLKSGTDNSYFQFASMNDLFNITMARDDNATNHLFELLDGVSDDTTAISMDASLRDDENHYYKPATQRETGHTYYVVQSIEYSNNASKTDNVRLAAANDATNLYKEVAESDATVIAMYQNEVIYLAAKSDQDEESTVYYIANTSGHTANASGVYELYKDSYLKENYYLSIFTDISRRSDVYHYTVGAEDKFDDNAHPSQVESPKNSKLALGNLYDNTFTIKDTDIPGESINPKIDLSTNNNTIRATLTSQIGLTAGANSINFGTLLTQNPNVKIYQSFLMYLNRQDPIPEGETEHPKPLNGLLTDSEPQIKVTSYKVNNKEVSGADSKENRTVTANYIEFRNNQNLHSLIASGATIEAQIELTYNTDNLIGQAFPMMGYILEDGVLKPDTMVGTKILGYSNIASDINMTARSTASTRPTSVATTRYYTDVKNSSTLAFEAVAADSTGLYGRLGINARSLAGADADGIVTLDGIASYDITKLNRRDSYDHIRLTYQLYKKQPNSNSYATLPEVIPTYLDSFDLYRDHEIKTSTMTYTADCVPNSTTPTSYVYELTKQQMNQHTLVEDSYEFLFPVRFGIYTGDDYFGKPYDDEEQRMYSNYKLLLKVELMNSKNEVIDEKTDWIVYTNAKIYADIVTDKSGT